MLNHFGGDETYLGWLVMTTKNHRSCWSEVNSEELESLGKNIRRINKALRHYWKKKYHPDKIEQIYAVYFNETPYKNKKVPSGNELRKQLHVHIHLLTRTEEMRESLCDPKYCLGWHLVDCRSCFPDKYKLSDKNYLKAKELMEYLQQEIIVKKTKG